MRLGIIGGTAMSELAIEGIDLVRSDNIIVETRYGSVPLFCVTTEKHELFFLERHHGEGMMPPHKINHRANIKALEGSGVDCILSVCSVGTIPTDFPPGSVGYATQYIDFTGVDMSYSNSDAVFTSMTTPFDEDMNKKLDFTLSKLQPGVKLARTYWLAHGPHFETTAEINAIEKLGGEVVGMTMPRECKLANELKIPYAAILVSSNWAAGRDPDDSQKPLNHEEVTSTATSKLSPVVECIKSFTQ
tara:strand:+ start:658 stop:1395 length:738 start_codon:yes stop_codon:yes gene_type:complete